MTLYETLGILPTATAEEIRAAWHTIARTCHPDKTKDPEKIERFKLAAEARATLLDPDQRAAYDADLVRERPPEVYLCARCRAIRVAREGDLCAPCLIHAAQRMKPRPKPRRMKRRIHLDLDLDNLQPIWAMQGSNTDEVLAHAMQSAALRMARGRRRGTRLEIPVGDVVVVVDESTIMAINGIARNIDAVGRLMKAVRGWFG